MSIFAQRLYLGKHSSNVISTLATKTSSTLNIVIVIERIKLTKFESMGISVMTMKSLMFEYGRMQKKIPPRLVCGSRGTCLVNMLPGIQVTTGQGFFVC